MILSQLPDLAEPTEKDAYAAKCKDMGPS